MKTHLISTPLEGVWIIEVEYYQDDRGFFIEPWNKRDFAEAGFIEEFVQEGHSRSHYGVLRGLHYQNLTAPMGKLVRCTLGHIYDVAVDLRVSSPTFGKYFSIELSAENKKQLYIPPGFGHGFEALDEFVEVQYKQTGFYTPSSEGTILWCDPDIGIDWPIKNPALSKRDQNGTTLKQYLENPAFP